MFDFTELQALGHKYEGNVVAYYDQTRNQLDKKLYRIDGIQYWASQINRLVAVALKPIDANPNDHNAAFWTGDTSVIPYEELVFIYDSTKRLFDQSKEIFKGCFHRSLLPLKNDLETLETLLAEYDKLGLIIEEDDTECVNTAELSMNSIHAQSARTAA